MKHLTSEQKHQPFYRRAPFGYLGLLGLQAVLGCSVIFNPDRNPCSTDVDCHNLGPAFAGSVCVNSMCQTDPKWACAEHPLTQETQAAVQASITAMSIVDFAPVAGVHATLCGTLDLECLTPVAQADTDAAGIAPLGIPSGFSGYVIMESQKVVPQLFFPNFPISEGGSLGTAYMNASGAMESLASQLGDVVQAGRGLLVIQAVDCQGAFATGVTAEFSGNLTGSHPYYALNGIPSGVPTSTDSTGVAGLLNTVPGTMGVKVRYGGRLVGETSLMVRDGYMSFRVIQPGIPNPVDLRLK